MKKSKFLKLFAAILLLLLCSAFFAACSSGGESVTAIGSVEINKDKQSVTLKATLDSAYAESHSKDKLYIVSIDRADLDNTLDGAVAVAESKAKKNMTFDFSLYGDDGRSRLASGFVLAEKNGESYTALTSPAYIQNPELLAAVASQVKNVSSIKGLEQNDVLDAKLLGAAQIVLDVSIDSLLSPNYREDTVSYNYDGITYFFYRDRVEELDSRVSDADKLGMKIYIRTVLRYPSEDEDADKDTEPREVIEALYARKIADAEGYVVNMENPDAKRYISALYSFLASRYSGEYGNVSDYIIGEKVNEYGKYCNAGANDAEEFEKLYYSWIRTAALVLSSQNSNAGVYVPVSSSWRIDGASGKIGSKAFLARFASDAKSGGDYNYSLAFDLGGGEDLPALLGSDGHDYSNIGIESLSEVVSFADSAEMRFKSEKRSMIIDGLALPASVSQKNRAAYYTYAYYTAAENGFKAFIYSSDKSSLYTSDGERSDLYYSAFMCGSSLYSQLSGYTDKITTHPEPKFSDFVANTLTYDQSVDVEVAESVKNVKKALPIPYTSFNPLGSVYNSQLALSKDGERLWLVESLSDGGFGAVSTTIKAENINSAGYIGVTMSSKSAPAIALVLSDPSSHTYIGEAKTANAETTYYFKISDFTGDVESSSDITLTLVLFPDDGEVSSVEIKEIALYGTSAGGLQSVVIIIIVALVALASVGLIVWLVIRRKRKAERRYDGE